MKSQNPWMGRAKGSAGGMTASKVYDKNVLKAKAFEVNNPNTAAQQNQRTFFKEVTELVNQLTEEQCRFLCPKAPKGMSRRNFLSKQLASYVTTSSGQKVVDLANVKTIGNAPQTKIITSEVNVTESTISASFEIDENALEKYASNILYTLMINVTKKKVILHGGNTSVEDLFAGVETPANWQTTDTINAIGFISNNTSGEADMMNDKALFRP